MNRKILINSAAVLMLLVGISTIFVSSAHAHPGEEPNPPPPWKPPTTPEPPGDGDSGDTGDNKKSTSVITQIFKVMFDTPTMKDAIVNSIDVIFNDAVLNLTMRDNPLYKMGSEISEIVFESANLKEVRRSSWVELRKVAFALLPLTAALTIWASMKEGLYSVTGYANTFEAVAEFFVSIALALASFWLMEQAISLTKILTLAIDDSLQVEITRSVYGGMLIKPAILGMTNPVMSMILNILAFALILTYMGSVTIAFLAREVVLVMTVAMAPVMIILGSVRPLGWLRGLWSKAFLVFLLLLPINVLTMGISYKLWIAALDLSTGAVATVLQLLILTGTISILIAVNGTLGKLVYGAAIEVAQKVGESVAAVASLAVAAAGGVGALLGGAGAVAGTAPVVAGGGGTGGSMALASTGGGAVTSTSQLTSTIGNVLSSSRNGILRSMGGGLKAGNAIRDHKLATAPPPPSPKLNIDENGMPGYEKGIADVEDQFDTKNTAAGKGNKPEVLGAKTRIGGDTAVANLRAAENTLGSGRDTLEEMGYIHRGKYNIEQAGREYIRAEAGSFALGQHRNKYQQNKVSEVFPNTSALHHRDFAVGLRIVQGEQKSIMGTDDKSINDPTPDYMGKVAQAVHTRRLSSGLNSYGDIIDSAANSDLDDWVKFS